jgi:hypothetical protein
VNKARPNWLTTRRSVEPTVADIRRRTDGVEDPLDAGAQVLLLGGATASAAAGVRGIGQVEEVGAFGLVELEGTCQGFQHGLGNAGGVPAFETGVVVGADAGEQGDLLAA